MLFSFFAVFRNQQDTRPDLYLSAYLAVLRYVSTKTRFIVSLNVILEP